MNRLALIIGSILPDVVDKMLVFLKLANGRGYFHTVLFAILCFSILFLLSKGNKIISISFLIGMTFHLLLDLPGVPLFYPFIYYDFMYTEDPFSLWMHTLLTNPVVQATELFGVFILIFIVINNKLYNFKNIANYLITNPEIIIHLKKDTELIISED